MTLTDAVRSAIYHSRFTMKKDKNGSSFVSEVHIPMEVWAVVMKTWREERQHEIAQQGLKDLREAIYGESK
jgi:hypothetical protein